MKKNKSTLFRLVSYTRPYAPLLIISLISAMVSVAVSILVPLTIGDAIDCMKEGAVDFDKVFEYIYILIAMIAIGSVSQWTLSASTNALTFKTVRNIRNQLFEHINKLPLKFIDSQQQGDIIARISSDIDQVSEGLLQGFTQLFSGVMTIIATIAMLFYINLDNCAVGACTHSPFAFRRVFYHETLSLDFCRTGCEKRRDKRLRRGNLYRTQTRSSVLPRRRLSAGLCKEKRRTL